ncbi:MAG: DsbE family thiol:disulfide interchange protein [Alphaproteobacteria bacterium GM7ARS4]|nr:DsbE family thiol:disulfide interchange protein [Alphaproteobacteria bacterium GM7ARS4]
MMSLTLRLLPLLVVSALMVGLYQGFKTDPHRIPSPLMETQQKAPSLNGTPSLTPENPFPQNTQTQPYIVNVFASWCLPCRYEHPLITALSQQFPHMPIYAINYKDKKEDALSWLRRYGNPYTAIAPDHDGTLSITWGVGGVPETFIVDGEGIIRYHLRGPITQRTMEHHVLPLLASFALPATAIAPR